MTRAWEILAVAFVFLAAFAALFADPLFTDRVWFRRDLASYFIPAWTFGVESMRAGVFPLWNPYVFGGTSFFAHLQSCVLYPPTIVFYFGGVTAGLNFYLVLHLAAAAAFMYAWARHAGAGRAAAAFGGFAYGLSGPMLGILNNPIILCSAAWFPLVFLRFQKLREKRTPGRVVRAALALLAAALAGDPAVAFISAFAMLCLAAPRPKNLAAAAAAVALCAALGAFQFVPFAEKIADSSRAAPSYEKATVWSVRPADLAGLAVPFWPSRAGEQGDYWQRQSLYENYYLGFAVLVFALIGARRLRRDRLGPAACVALLGLALVCGRHLPFYKLFYDWVPLASNLRYPARFLFLISFGAAALGAFGFDAMLRARPFGIPKRSLAAVFIALGAADLAAANAWREPSIEKAVITAAPPTVQKLRAEEGRFRVLPSEPEPAIDSLGFIQALNGLLPNTNVLHRIETMAGYDAFQDRVMHFSAERFRSDPSELRETLIDVSNTRLTVERGVISRNEDAMPRAFVLDEAVAAPGDEGAAVCLSREGFDPARTLCLDATADEIPAAAASSSADERERVEAAYPDANTARLTVKAGRPMWLYLADRFERNWRCTVNGEPARIYRANLLFRAVRVPAGQSTVEFRYRPFSAYAGFAASAAAVLAAAGLVGYTLYMKRRAAPISSDRRGFTLVEILMVIVIVGMLASAAMMLYADVMRTTREGATRGGLGAIRSGVYIFYSRQATTGTARFPETIAELISVFPNNQLPRNEMIF